jgi:radical SAM superfamily enzyme YgiQ (UPF0313 family)
MRRSGLSRVFIGAESGSDDVLKSVNKVRFQGTRILHQVAEKCFRAGITCTFSLIFALPDETEADRRQTLAMIREIKSKYPTTEFHQQHLHALSRRPEFSSRPSKWFARAAVVEQWADFYPKFQRLPWINARTHREIQRMRDYIRIAYGAAPIRQRSNMKSRRSNDAGAYRTRSAEPVPLCSSG